MNLHEQGGPAEPDFVDPLGCYEPPVYRDQVEAALADQSVSDIHAVPIATIDADVSVGVAVRQLADHHIACLMVMEEERLVGVFTERDVLMRLAEGFDQWSDRPVREFMTLRPACVLDSDSVATAVCVLAVEGYRHVPVLDADDAVVGIVSPNRVLDYLRHQLAEL